MIPVRIVAPITFPPLKHVFHSVFKRSVKILPDNKTAYFYM